ncbi:hypothetical protein IMCC3317_04390 [Kordia antarctica]|uniref:HTH LytTR-type domain-containing protein n=1 Tax=Kordia antarctica TaxID=1218801 RepID=A0A7L4ZEG0_9FLAO|nr:LytTR family transcriptional regulator DNA-binding domain-containing protein [Kordia antarctica]QHI35093.1 hypothetical protein IMCC3317_04390 [Kordia antarctica]
MTAKLLKYLQEPYPYLYRNTHRLLLVLGIIGVLSLLFSYAFEPFEVNVSEHKLDYFWISCIHAFLPFPIAFLYFTLLNLSMKDDSRWTLGKEMMHLCFLLIAIGIGSFLIRDLIYTNPDNWSFHYFFEEIRNSLLVGALLLTIVLPLNLERLIHKNTKSLQKLKLQTATESFKQQIITISSNNEKYQFDVHQFLFAKVESNYTEIYTYKADEVNKTLFRITLKELETHLQAFPHIYKTHRSYLVNLHKITACVGNAQGYQLSLKNYAETVPVSRSNIKAFNAYFSKI